MKRTISSQIQPIGLDLGAGSIKMLQLEVRPLTQVAPASADRDAEAPRPGSSATLAVVAAASIAISDPQPPQAGELPPAHLAALRQMLDDHPFVGRSVVAAIPRSTVHVKTLRLSQRPELDPAGAPLLDASARTDLATLFPFDLDQAVIQCISAGPVRHAESGGHELIVLAAPCDAIERFLAALDSAGVVVASLDCHPNALFRSIERFGRRGDDTRDAQLLVDIGARQTQVVIGRGRTLQFCRTIDVGGLHLLEAVAAKLGITVAEAHALRQGLVQESQSFRQPRSTASEQTGVNLAAGAPAAGAPRADAPTASHEHPPALTIAPALPRRNRVGQAVSDATRRLADELGRELMMCLRYHAVSFRGHPPRRVRLAGGIAEDAQLRAALASVLTLPVEAAQPLFNIDTTRLAPADRTGTASQWALAAGLAMRFTKGYFAAADGVRRTTAKPDPQPANDDVLEPAASLKLPQFPEAAVA